MKKILLFSRDPGGANVVGALVSSLKDKNYNVKLYGKDYALNKYLQFGFTGLNIEDELKEITLQAVTNFLIAEKPDFIITGASDRDFAERYIWKAAVQLNIPFFSIVDQWMNYSNRFSRDYLPIKILVMDEFAKKEMINLGIDENRIEITGHPYIDYLFNKKKLIENEFKESQSCEHAKNKNEIFITFATEAIKESSGNDNLGYSDESILREVFQCIGDVVTNSNKKIHLILRLHPKDIINNYSYFISKLRNENIQIVLDKNVDPITSIISSDIIIGMSSMFLIEAAVLGKPILSVQIGLKDKNPFIFNQTGQLKSILTTEELNVALNNFINLENYSEFELNFKSDAIESIINLMEELL